MTVIGTIFGVGAAVMIESSSARRGVRVFFKPDGRHRLPHD
jgi:hypothetical protein